jgi:hypothetical protein
MKQALNPVFQGLTNLVSRKKCNTPEELFVQAEAALAAIAIASSTG